MAYVDACKGSGITLKDLKEFIKKCDEQEINNDVQILISYQDYQTHPVKRITGFEESIVFFNKI